MRAILVQFVREINKLLQVSGRSHLNYLVISHKANSNLSSDDGFTIFKTTRTVCIRDSGSILKMRARQVPQSCKDNEKPRAMQVYLQLPGHLGINGKSAMTKSRDVIIPGVSPEPPGRTHSRRLQAYTKWSRHLTSCSARHMPRRHSCPAVLPKIRS